MLLFDLGILLTFGACVWLLLELAGARGPLSRRLPFMLLAALAGLWAASEMFVAHAQTPHARLVARQLLYVGAGYFPTVWLWASSALARPSWYRRAPWLVALAALPGFAISLWLQPEMIARFPHPERFGLQAGPVFWSSIIWAWAVISVGIAQFLMAARRMLHASRERMVVIAVCASLPLLSELLYQCLRVRGPDPTPILLGFCGIGIRFALFDAGLGASLPLGPWAVFDQLHTGVLLADVEEQVVDANPAARRLLGDRRPQGEPLADLLESVRGDAERVIEVERVPLRRRFAGPVGSAVLLTDRTEAVRLEEHLREQQRVESLGLLAGGLAHDFQNLLTGILAGAGLTRMTLEPRHPARKPLADVVQGARTASRLTQQLLALSGRPHVEGEPLSLSREVRALEGLITRWLPRGVALDLDLAADLPAVEADRVGLQQVITNLAVNAAQAARGSGLVCIRTDVAELDGADLARLVPGSRARAGRHVVLEVSDDGSGMDPATRARIFEPFFSTREHGHGLGLAAVLAIVHRHGGGIAVDSEPGAGSTFRVFLPASDARLAPETEPAERELHATGSGTVLVVEDEDALREIVSGALERMGYTVLRAEDGSEAIEMFRDRGDGIDLVLLDLEMPGVGGMEAWNALREIRDDVRVVLTSAFREGEVPSAGSTGAAGVLRKPYDLEDLFAVVREALAGERKGSALQHG